MDLAKAVSLSITHEGDLLTYTAGLGGAGKIGPVAPLIAIPTTAGTGNEVSSGAVIIMDNGDPTLTEGLPSLLTAATGMDAMTHCVEALLSPVVNPPGRGGCLGWPRAWDSRRTFAARGERWQ